jgi:hypothetical protein
MYSVVNIILTYIIIKLLLCERRTKFPINGDFEQNARVNVTEKREMENDDRGNQARHQQQRGHSTLKQILQVSLQVSGHPFFLIHHPEPVPV